jgi:hypothetical protein
MPASKHLKILSVRLPESEIRRIKSLAASRGVTVQEAIQEALQSWASENRATAAEPLDALEGSLSDVDVLHLAQQEKETELRKDRHWR